ncbi:MAG: excinuclease ABC subunit B [Candidatus Muiribacterium halophilum]|uniref:UvrABC system protein B n=1 Tax=Muiribacterium halophilum TaxID=2053465 RepID=A0A2N5ZHA8_MUIH1|nr:MAG: excinuclease ABC subunit B [Candidatus Muirbacterium halophilum]
MDFVLESPFEPAGDQPLAIQNLSERIQNNIKDQILLGVTGSGKTFTMANVIKKVKRPTLVITHNKTLAAQLFNEFKKFFPKNAVEYFVSYYDYYQPESYIVRSDTYIEKDSSVNEKIDRLRHNATASILSRRDVVVVASVSSIYNIGKPDYYMEASLMLSIGQTIRREDILSKLIDMQYERNDFSLGNGMFKVKGEIIEIMPPYFDGEYLRIEMFDDEIENISLFTLIEQERIYRYEEIRIFPAKHYVIPERNLESAIEAIRAEMFERVKFFRDNGRMIEAQRIEQRTRYDLEMIEEFGYCKGIENYSRFFDGRNPGDPPWSLMSYFPEDYLLIIDESHMTVPQLNAMYNGDRSRKQNLIDYGFRLPSAYDNRPLRFEEFEERVNQCIFVSATPGDYEYRKTDKDHISELIVRPTGIVEPEIHVEKTKGQVFRLIEKIREKLKDDLKIIVNTLTKKMSEELTSYLIELDFRVKYLHSEIHTIDRTKILNQMKKDEIDIIIGVNLLREGIDLPEVGLVVIFDGDKEGFLRSERALVQLCGRCARNVEGEVLIFADNMTRSLKNTIETINARREKQIVFNRIHNITPKTIQNTDINMLETYVNIEEDNGEKEIRNIKEARREINTLRYEMKLAASMLEFERAANLRDRIKFLEQIIAENT